VIDGLTGDSASSCVRAVWRAKSRDEGAALRSGRTARPGAQRVNAQSGKRGCVVTAFNVQRATKNVIFRRTGVDWQ
jgi:hypothetical protein